MEFEFSSTLIEWRGPAPFVFAPVPPEVAEEIKSIASRVTYGWGVIPVTLTLGETKVTTSLFPRQGSYLVPIKIVIQRAEGVTIGDEVSVKLTIDC
jgi:hypothetical protein